MILWIEFKELKKMGWRIAPYKFFFEGYPFFAALRYCVVNAALIGSGFLLAWLSTYWWTDLVRFNEVWFGFVLGFSIMCTVNIIVVVLALDYAESKEVPGS
tara:strand:- start:870 stop:1172 length:303 start_codon:yes stop_codon:yes gene_type:complete